eukprot:COSAG02_NODE_418_length_22698_cov_7.471127_2_plen_53_part_00
MTRCASVATTPSDRRPTRRTICDPRSTEFAIALAGVQFANVSQSDVSKNDEV